MRNDNFVRALRRGPEAEELRPNLAIYPFADDCVGQPARTKVCLRIKVRLHYRRDAFGLARRHKLLPRIEPEGKAGIVDVSAPGGLGGVDRVPVCAHAELVVE